ncbi:MAG: cbb3-type cytochrome oxidase assembly protein CcoS [Proteobacteria bacterium]|nr:cbb3-type cytochrome oxidase assembly protein CcoS [Pseudomonadota bacterium]
MDILFLLIPLSVVLVFFIGILFWFALRGGQFDDLESPGLNVVLDDDGPAQEKPEAAATPERIEGSVRSKRPFQNDRNGP